MKIRLNVLVILVLTLALTVSFAGCANKEAEKSGETAEPVVSQNNTQVDPQDDGRMPELVMGLSAEPSTLDPHIQSGQATRVIKQNLYRGLVAYGADGQIGYELAESYSVSDDNLVYTFVLRDASFHDGSKVTAEDVKFSIERIMDEEVGATFGSDFRLIVDSVVVVNEKTVDIKLKEPASPFVDYLALPESVIVSKAWCEANGNDLHTNPMGNGPYTYTSWENGREIVITAFDEYYKEGKPETDSIRFVFIPDASTRANALRTGEVDLIDYVPSAEVITFEEEDEFVVDISVAPFMMLQFDCSDGPLADSRVRQAIAYAIDREGVIQTAFMGRGTPIYGFPTIVGQNGYDGKYDNYFTENLDKAKELLAEAGYPDGFETKILATSTYGMHEQTALVVQDSLKKIGITAEAELPDWSTRIDRSIVGDYEILVSGTAGNIVDMDWATNYFASGETRMNSSPGYSNEEIDRLLNEGRTTLDPEKRMEIYDEFRLKALEESNFVYINFREQCFVRADYVEGFVNLDGILTYCSGITLENVVVR